jgi:16S rRNA (guanine527-N7)-methyltransferase
VARAKSAATPPDPLDELARAIEVIAGRPATAEIRGRFAKYLALLTSWNRTHHLTAYRTPRDVVRGLFLDSLLFFPLLPVGARRLVDIGAGPGIPGVPLRIVEPTLLVTLIESRHKPVSFLEALKRELHLPEIEVVHGRAEDRPGVGSFDCVVMRGVKVNGRIAASARSHLSPGGRLIVAGGPDAAQERDLPNSRRENVSIPQLGISRYFLVTDV